MRKKTSTDFQCFPQITQLVASDLPFNEPLACISQFTCINLFHMNSEKFRGYLPRIMKQVVFSSVAQSCPTLCNPMNHSRPGLPVHHQLPEFTQTHVHWVGDDIHLILCWPFSSCLQSFTALGSFPMSQFFASGGKSIGVSASASVLPMNAQDWSPLRWTGWISLQSKGLSRVFSNTTVQKHQFFCAQISL